MNILAAIDLLLALADRVGRVSEMIKAARAEGRDDLTDEELVALQLEDDAARVDFANAIEQARAEGR